MSSQELGQIDDGILLELGHAVWSWQLCSGCQTSNSCLAEACPAKRKSRNSRYFQFYASITSLYSESAREKSEPLRTHEELQNGIIALRDNPQSTRAQFADIICPGSPHMGSRKGCLHSLSETTLAVQVLTMINSSPLHHSSDMLEKGGARLHWKDELPFAKYVQDLFPLSSHPTWSYPGSDTLSDMKSQLKATKLKKIIGLEFRPTYELQNDLRLYRKENVLEVFHHAGFIKEKLRMTRESSSADPLLPRQLLLEVLESLQGTLFPLSDHKSKSLLQSLVSSQDFDPELLRFEFSSIRRVDEEAIGFVYLADRLSELYEELRNPQPRGWLQRQMQRRSNSRHMMIATLVGVIFAVLLGIASLVVSSYQTWIAYQAWQHPIVQPQSQP